MGFHISGLHAEREDTFQMVMSRSLSKALCGNPQKTTFAFREFAAHPPRRQIR
jgi:hypothetical protein